MHFIEKYRLEITLFVSGATVMIFEILGSRMYGPFMGTSTFVWTSLIGVILGFLSLWYYIGWIKADMHASRENIANILFAAAASMFFVFITKDNILRFFQLSDLSVELSTFLSSIILFWPAWFFLWLVSPFAVRLKIENLENSGSVVWRMYAIGTLGSIVGTFAAWFFLIPLFGTNSLLLSLIVVVLTLSLFISKKPHFYIRLGLTIFFLLAVVLNSLAQSAKAQRWYIDTDTKYSRIHVYDSTDSDTGKKVRTMQINAENHSEIFLESDELVHEYTKYYHLIQAFFPDFKSGLMLWWWAYSFPKDYIKKYPNNTLDVVEIDPWVTEIAKEHFGLMENERMNIIHADARTYLNTTRNKYDAIFSDAFGSYYSIPYQLTTREAVQKKYDILTENGIVLSNIISGIDGEKWKFFRAEYHTYKEIFPHVYIFPVDNNYDGKSIRNIMLVATKSPTSFDLWRSYWELDQYLGNLWENEVANDFPILTDDFAPVNSYIADMF